LIHGRSVDFNPPGRRQTVRLIIYTRLTYPVHVLTTTQLHKLIFVQPALALHLLPLSLGRRQRLLGHATRTSDNRIPKARGTISQRTTQTTANMEKYGYRRPEGVSKLSWEDLQATAAEDSDGVSVRPSASWSRMNQGQNTPPTATTATLTLTTIPTLTLSVGYFRA